MELTEPRVSKAHSREVSGHLWTEDKEGKL